MNRGKSLTYNIIVIITVFTLTFGAIGAYTQPANAGFFSTKDAGEKYQQVTKAGIFYDVLKFDLNGAIPQKSSNVIQEAGAGGDIEDIKSKLGESATLFRNAVENMPKQYGTVYMSLDNALKNYYENNPDKLETMINKAGWASSKTDEVLAGIAAGTGGSIILTGAIEAGVAGGTVGSVATPAGAAIVGSVGLAAGLVRGLWQWWSYKQSLKKAFINLNNIGLKIVEVGDSLKIVADKMETNVEDYESDVIAGYGLGGVEKNNYSEAFNNKISKYIDKPYDEDTSKALPDTIHSFAMESMPNRETIDQMINNIQSTGGIILNPKNSKPEAINNGSFVLNFISVCQRIYHPQTENYIENIHKQGLSGTPEFKSYALSYKLLQLAEERALKGLKNMENATDSTASELNEKIELAKDMGLDNIDKGIILETNTISNRFYTGDSDMVSGLPELSTSMIVDINGKKTGGKKAPNKVVDFANSMHSSWNTEKNKVINLINDLEAGEEADISIDRDRAFKSANIMEKYKINMSRQAMAQGLETSFSRVDSRLEQMTSGLDKLVNGTVEEYNKINELRRNAEEGTAYRKLLAKGCSSWQQAKERISKNTSVSAYQALEDNNYDRAINRVNSGYSHFESFYTVAKSIEDPQGLMKEVTNKMETIENKRNKLESSIDTAESQSTSIDEVELERAKNKLNSADADIESAKNHIDRIYEDNIVTADDNADIFLLNETLSDALEDITEGISIFNEDQGILDGINRKVGRAYENALDSIDSAEDVLNFGLPEYQGSPGLELSNMIETWKSTVRSYSEYISSDDVLSDYASNNVLTNNLFEDEMSANFYDDMNSIAEEYDEWVNSEHSEELRKKFITVEKKFTYSKRNFDIDERVPVKIKAHAYNVRPDVLSFEEGETMVPTTITLPIQSKNVDVSYVFPKKNVTQEIEDYQMVSSNITNLELPLNSSEDDIDSYSRVKFESVMLYEVNPPVPMQENYDTKGDVVDYSAIGTYAGTMNIDDATFNIEIPSSTVNRSLLRVTKLPEGKPVEAKFAGSPEGENITKVEVMGIGLPKDNRFQLKIDWMEDTPNVNYINENTSKNDIGGQIKTRHVLHLKVNNDSDLEVNNAIVDYEGLSSDSYNVEVSLEEGNNVNANPVSPKVKENGMKKVVSWGIPKIPANTSYKYKIAYTVMNEENTAKLLLETCENDENSVQESINDVENLGLDLSYYQNILDNISDEIDQAESSVDIGEYSKVIEDLRVAKERLDNVESDIIEISNKYTTLSSSIESLEEEITKSEELINILEQDSELSDHVDDLTVEKNTATSVKSDAMSIAGRGEVQKAINLVQSAKENLSNEYSNVFEGINDVLTERKTNYTNKIDTLKDRKSNLEEPPFNAYLTTQLKTAEMYLNNIDSYLASGQYTNVVKSLENVSSMIESSESVIEQKEHSKSQVAKSQAEQKYSNIISYYTKAKTLFDNTLVSNINVEQNVKDMMFTDNKQEIISSVQDDVDYNEDELDSKLSTVEGYSDSLKEAQKVKNAVLKASSDGNYSKAIKIYADNKNMLETLETNLKQRKEDALSWLDSPKDIAKQSINDLNTELSSLDESITNAEEEGKNVSQARTEYNNLQDRYEMINNAFKDNESDLSYVDATVLAKDAKDKATQLSDEIGFGEGSNDGDDNPPETEEDEGLPLTIILLGIGIVAGLITVLVVVRKKKPSLSLPSLPIGSSEEESSSSGDMFSDEDSEMEGEDTFEEESTLEEDSFEENNVEQDDEDEDFMFEE